ncbi:hypothetical protein HMPREF9078_01245 [Capnocytophaga sp. oral taxon 380 str. F0488]|nr:hypothetical protein C3V44_01245 [Capnocytophaga sp. oral taxon 864]EKY07279.1 hypothetical protein HMPREF9078_01245 [Capnocytophaga sp. oral taxon 380 str. F0488]
MKKRATFYAVKQKILFFTLHASVFSFTSYLVQNLCKYKKSITFVENYFQYETLVYLYIHSYQLVILC